MVGPAILRASWGRGGEALRRIAPKGGVAMLAAAAVGVAAMAPAPARAAPPYTFVSAPGDRRSRPRGQPLDPPDATRAGADVQASVGRLIHLSGRPVRVWAPPEGGNPARSFGIRLHAATGDVRDRRGVPHASQRHDAHRGGRGATALAASGPARGECRPGDQVHRGPGPYAGPAGCAQLPQFRAAHGGRRIERVLANARVRARRPVSRGRVPCHRERRARGRRADRARLDPRARSLQLPRGRCLRASDRAAPVCGADPARGARAAVADRWASDRSPTPWSRDSGRSDPCRSPLAARRSTGVDGSGASARGTPQGRRGAAHPTTRRRHRAVAFRRRRRHGSSPPKTRRRTGICTCRRRPAASRTFSPEGSSPCGDDTTARAPEFVPSV